MERRGFPHSGKKPRLDSRAKDGKQAEGGGSRFLQFLKSGAAWLARLFWQGIVFLLNLFFPANEGSVGCLVVISVIFALIALIVDLFLA